MKALLKSRSKKRARYKILRSFRFTEEMDKSLRAEAERTGRTQTKVIEMALAVFLSNAA